VKTATRLSVAGHEQSRRDDSRAAGATSGILALIALSASLALLPWLRKAAFPDEAVTLRSARLGWTALWQQSHVMDLVLLPYYSLVHLWIQLSGTIEWVRLLSLLAFGVTVLLVGLLGVRLGGRTCGVLAAIVAATNPLLVTSALSARPYALSAVAATISVASLIRWFRGGGTGWVRWFCLAAIATLLLQMFALLAPLSVLVAAVALKPEMFRRRWRSLIAPIGLMLTVALAFAMLAASQRGQIAWIPSLFEGRQLITAMTGPASGAHSLYAMVVLAVVTVAIALCLRARSRGRFRPARRDLELLALLLAWAALPTAALAASSLVKPVFVDRYVTSSVPGLAIAIALLAARAYNVTAAPWAQRSRVIVGGSVLAIAAAAVWFACSLPAAQALYQTPLARGQSSPKEPAVGLGVQAQLSLPPPSPPPGTTTLPCPLPAPRAALLPPVAAILSSAACSEAP
jgi:mannosyltransferase